MRNTRRHIQLIMLIHESYENSEIIFGTIRSLTMVRGRTTKLDQATQFCCGLFYETLKASHPVSKYLPIEASLF